MIELNGNYGEGGGALIRTALALSTLTGQEFRVINIRSRRPNPGLKPQHLTAIKALKEICAAKTNNVELGSKLLHYLPGKIKSGTYEIDIGTAGSISLLLQALILPCMFAPGKVTLKIKGGTCGKWQASVDYLQNVLLPQLQRFVEKIELKVLKRGYFPKGGGEVHLEISPRFKLKDFADFPSFLEKLRLKTAVINLLEQGKLEQIRGIVNVSSELEEKEIGERMRSAAINHLKKYNVPTTIRLDYAQSLSIGGEIVLWAVFSTKGEVDYTNPIIIGADALVEKGKTSEQIGQEAAKKLSQEIDSETAVDKHLADQLIPFMGLLPESKIVAKERSKHLETNIYVVEKFLDVKFRLEGDKISVKENK